MAPEHSDDASGEPSGVEDAAFDPAVLIEVANLYLLGEAPSLNRREVSEQTGVPLQTAIDLWRSLGFPTVGDDHVAFTSADVEALRITDRLADVGLVSPETVLSFARAMGQSFARLADWQVRLLMSSLQDVDDDDLVLERVDEVLPMVAQLQDYLWRRHLASAASRIALRESAVAGQDTAMAIGFVDIVGYTSRSRQISARSLAYLVEDFEQATADLLTEMGGRVIKTIGDEVLYAIDDPEAAVEIAVALTERSQRDEDFPEVRVGSAYGPVLVRLGDVFGPVVNLAARLTSIARPGRTVIDAALAERVRGQTLRYRVKRMRRTSVKGFDAIEIFSVRRPNDRERAKVEARTGGTDDD